MIKVAIRGNRAAGKFWLVLYNNGVEHSILEELPPHPVFGAGYKATNFVRQEDAVAMALIVDDPGGEFADPEIVEARPDAHRCDHAVRERG